MVDDRHLACAEPDEAVDRDEELLIRRNRTASALTRWAQSNRRGHRGFGGSAVGGCAGGRIGLDCPSRRSRAIGRSSRRGRARVLISDRRLDLLGAPPEEFYWRWEVAPGL